MRRIASVLVLGMLIAVWSPAEAKTPRVFTCSAGVTLTFESGWSALTWTWGITAGTGVCKTIPATQTYDGTLSEAGGSTLPSGTILYGATFGFDVRLRLTGRATGETRTYRHFWEGRRINCSVARFTARLPGPTTLPVGTGNLRYCGPIPTGPPPAPESHPGSVTWNFLGL